MRRATLMLSMLALCVGTTGLHPAQSAQAAPAGGRAVVVLVPGAGSALVQRMIADGVMPHLARLKAEGVSVPLQSAPAAGTQAAPTALWTGSWGAGEPLIHRVSAAKKPALALHVGSSAVSGPESPLGVLKAEALAGDGLWTEARGLAPARGWEGLPPGDRPPLESTMEVGGTPLFALLLGDPADPAPGYDTVWLTTSRQAAPLARLKPHAPMTRNAWSGPVPLGSEAHGFFRLFALAPDGRALTLYHSAPQRWATNRPAGVEPGWGHLDGPATAAYSRGDLGRPLAEGGDGTAEARYLDTVRFCLYLRQQTVRPWLRSAPWTVAVNELPLPGPVAEMWLGYLTPRSPSYDPQLAEALTPAMRQVFVEVDAYVGALRQSMPPGAHLFVVGDAGYAPARWNFLPNVVLRRSGLLALDADGRIDLARTQVYLPDPGGRHLVVNVTGRPGGVVPPAEVKAVLTKARAALRAITVKTPGGMVPLVRELWEPTPEQQKRFGLGGAGAQLYLGLQPGYVLSSEVSGELPFIDRPSNQSAAYPSLPSRPDAAGMMVAWGPSIKRGASVSGVQLIDVLPTVARLVGVSMPQAQGTALTRILR